MSARLNQMQLDNFSLISERSDLLSVASTLGLLASQLIDANVGGDAPKALDDETLNRWCDAVSFLGMSVRRVVLGLEEREVSVSGRPAIRSGGGWDFWESQK